ncbi:MAG: hypothetical protein IBJ11_02290 [Phycisphaerales bacterium]|nr:hypothetical protein [Phycisphaerales bacterium]
MRSAILAAACLALPALSSGAQLQTLTFNAPVLQRWMYPFDTQPGYRATASVFSTIGAPTFPGFTFDQRDGQVVIGFDTLAQLPTGLGACNYRVLSARLTIGVATDQAFRYKDTYDGWQSYLATPDPTDPYPPRAIELYGAGFRNGWTSATFFQGVDASNPGPPFGPSVSSDVRNVYATDFKDGVARDVSNNVRDQFDPLYFAIGKASGVSPGQYVPVNTEFAFDLQVSQANVQNYLRQAVNDGRLRLVITSLQKLVPPSGPGPASGEYATFYVKQNDFGTALVARLTMRVVVNPQPGDIDGDGVVGANDLTVLLTRFGQAVGVGDAADLDCTGSIGANDLTILLTNFGRGTPYQP